MISTPELAAEAARPGPPIGRPGSDLYHRTFEAALESRDPVLVAARAAAGGDEAGSGEAAEVGRTLGARVEAEVAAAREARGWARGQLAALIGSAIAAGRVLGLDAGRMAAAIGIAATQAAGLEALPADLQLAKAAADGLEAALLAERGFTAPPTALEGRRGLRALPAPPSQEAG